MQRSAGRETVLQPFYDSFIWWTNWLTNFFITIFWNNLIEVRACAPFKSRKYCWTLWQKKECLRIRNKVERYFTNENKSIFSLRLIHLCVHRAQLQRRTHMEPFAVDKYMIRSSPHQTTPSVCVVCMAVVFSTVAYQSRTYHIHMYLLIRTLPCRLNHTKRFCITNVPTIKSHELLQRAKQLLFIIHEYISISVYT